jgi:hypothetical protein
MKGLLHIIHCIDAGNAALKYLEGHRPIKVKEIISHYPSDDLQIVVHDRFMTCTIKACIS